MDRWSTRRRGPTGLADRPTEAGHHVTTERPGRRGGTKAAAARCAVGASASCLCMWHAANPNRLRVFGTDYLWLFRFGGCVQAPFPSCLSVPGPPLQSCLCAPQPAIVPLHVTKPAVPASRPEIDRVGRVQGAMCGNAWPGAMYRDPVAGQAYATIGGGALLAPACTAAYFLTGLPAVALPAQHVTRY